MNLEPHILVRPANQLEGEVQISGAKNSALKLMIATTLAKGTHILKNVPRILDVRIMSDLLTTLGSQVSWQGENELQITTPQNLNPEAPYELVEKMRASILILGPLLAACGEAQVAMPGGDNLGSRPVDMHINVLETLGAEVEVSHGIIRAKTEQLLGGKVVLEIPSVGATECALMSAARAKGATTIENAACEPEVVDLAAFLTHMGAHITGAGSSTIQIEGSEELNPTQHSIIPDRIEAATFLAALGIAGGEVLLRDARFNHLDVLCKKLGDMGMRISPDATGVWAMSKGRLKAVDFSTLPYPGVPTDCLPLLVAMLSVAEGAGIVTENLFEARFRYMDELIRMGADIRTEGQHAVVRGVEKLSGSPVRALDIRAGAALVCAGLNAADETQIKDIQHIDRGYENFVEKLKALGADIERFE